MRQNPDAIGEMLGYAQQVAERKRREPGDDIATTLVNAVVDGDRLTDAEFQWFFLLLVNGLADGFLNKLLLVIAVTFGTINVVGGFLVTDRMLEMFKTKPKELVEADPKEAK